MKRIYGWWVLLFVALFAITVAGREVSLVDAVKNGDLAAVRALLATQVDVNVAEPDGTTALHWAAHRDDLDAADLLIRAGANAQAANRYGVTPLWVACTNGNAAMIDRLLAAGADPNTALPNGETALMTAARTGSVAAVKALVARGADVQARERTKGQTALMWAAGENNAEVAQALIEAGADVAARSDGGAFSAYLFAVRGGHLDAARVLLAAGAAVNETMPDGTSALVLAVINAHYELAVFLLDQGADPNADAQGWTALHQLAWTRRPNTGAVNHLPGPVPTGQLDSLDLVGKLVARGADVNIRQTKEPRDGYRNVMNRIGATPFLLAAKAADVPFMRALLDQGADPTLTTVENTTPLMAAAGVGIWATGESPGTNQEALHAVELMLELGADVNAVDDNGDTALHGAALRGAPAMVQVLVGKGARLDVRNSPDIRREGGNRSGFFERVVKPQGGWTPLDIAEGVHYANVLRRHPETAALLRRLMEERGLLPAAAGRPSIP